MKKLFAVLCLSAVILFAACAKKNMAAKTKITNYTTDVLPLIQMKCTPCHLPSKGGNKASFEDYASAKEHATEMVERIELDPGQRGFMPFKHDKLTADEIAVFKKWVEGGTTEK